MDSGAVEAVTALATTAMAMMATRRSSRRLSTEEMERLKTCSGSCRKRERNYWRPQRRARPITSKWLT